MSVPTTLRTALLALLLAGAQSAPAVIVTLYDVDFGTPPHTVGATPAVGLGSDTPSSIFTGSPTVENALGGLNDQPLVFDVAGGAHDQIRFDIGQGGESYSLSFDVVVDDIAASSGTSNFVIGLSATTINNLFFSSIFGDPIRIFNGVIGGQQIGSYALDTVMHVDIDVDMLAEQWTVAVDGTQLFSGLFAVTAGDLATISFAMDGGTGGSGTVGIDNVLILMEDGTVASGAPEPASLALLGFGALALVAAGRRPRP